MLQGTCLVCLTVNRQTFDILNTHLQQVLEKIVDSKIEAASLCLCFICHKRMQQCYQLMQLAKTSQCYLNTMLTEKVDLNLKKQQPLLELTTSKMENISFSHFEYHIERDGKLKKEYLNDDMGQQGNYDESSKYTQGVTDDPLKDNSSEHDDQQNIQSNLKREVEEVAIECKGLAEINRDNDEQVKSIHVETSAKDCYRPEFSNILIAPNTENVNENRQNDPFFFLYFVPQYMFGQKPDPNNQNMGQQGNYDKSSTYTQGVTDDPLKDNSSEHDGQQNIPSNLKREVEEDAIECKGLAEINSDNDKQVTSVHVKSLLKLCYRPEVNRGNTNTQSITGKMFMCKDCHYVTNLKARLERHLTVHTGRVKPYYTCNICESKFGKRHALNIHKKKHQIKKNF